MDLVFLVRVSASLFLRRPCRFHAAAQRDKISSTCHLLQDTSDSADAIIRNKNPTLRWIGRMD